MAALETLVQRLNSAPNVPKHWNDLAEAMFAANDLAGLRNLFGYRHKCGLQALDFAFNVLLALGIQDRPQFLARTQPYPQDCPFSTMVLAVRACLLAVDHQLDQSIETLRLALARLAMVQGQMPDLRMDYGTLYKLAITATLFEPASWKPAAPIARLDTAFPHGEPVPSQFACAAFADPVYIRHYARDFVRGIQASAPGAALPVVGVLDPDAATVALLEELRAEVPDLVVVAVSYGGDKVAEMAASVRFVVANTLLDHLKRPLIMLDIDTNFRPEAGEVFREIAQHPLSYQNLGHLPPYLAVDACVVGAHPGEGSRRFFDIAGEYILGKLPENAPLWHIDQAALHRAVCLAAAPMTDLCALFRDRWTFPAFFKKDHSIDFADRAGSRSNAGHRGFSITPDGRVHWQKTEAPAQ